VLNNVWVQQITIVRLEISKIAVAFICIEFY